MSAIADITVFDGASTPVSHLLKAIDVTRTGGKVVANWRENLTGVPVYAQVRTSASLERLKSGVYKAEMRHVVPVMESISGQNAAGYTAAPKVAYENTFVQTGFFHERSDANGRKTCVQIGINISGNIATTVTPASAGPFVDLFFNLISPS